jgi:hypothetical protein
MRALLSVCLGLTLLGSLEGQSQVPGDQCLGGDLVAIQQDSIALKFNEKITIMRVAPDAEVWRRGVDLESIRQLVVGDDIYLACTRSGEDGTVMASLIAAVKSDDGVCVMRVNANTEIWRGEIFHDAGGLKLGDEISARSVVEYPGGELIAEQVDANITSTEGTIASVHSDRIVVNEHPGHVTVLFDARTNFDLDGGKLKKGATVRAVGLDLGHDTFRASTIVVEN